MKLKLSETSADVEPVKDVKAALNNLQLTSGELKRFVLHN